MAYPTAAELVAESNIPALTELSPEQQEDLYVQSVAAIEEFCGQTFDFVPDAEFTLSGSGTDVLYLPKRLEVVASLVVEGSALSAADVYLDTSFDRLVVKPNVTGSWNYYEQALYELSDSLPMIFAYDEDNVTILGDWGWSVFPEVVHIALRKDMEDTALADTNLLSQTIRSYRKFGMRDISQGNLRASFGFAPGLGDDVINMLQPYVWLGQVGYMV
jgi:hypothetical protein